MIQPEDQVRGIASQVGALVGFDAEDRQCLNRHRELADRWIPSLVTSFYDRLYAYPATRRIFREGEREMREATLTDWLRRAFGAEIDDGFWFWQWTVGMIHVRRQVGNPMVLAMMEHLRVEVTRRAVTELGAEEGLALAASFGKLTTIVSALIAEGYTLGSRLRPPGI